MCMCSKLLHLLSKFQLEAYEQINNLSHFLMGLNDSFTGIRGQMFMMKPLPTLNKSYSLLLQEESQRSTPVATVTENVAMNFKFFRSQAQIFHNKSICF